MTRASSKRKAAKKAKAKVELPAILTFRPSADVLTRISRMMSAKKDPEKKKDDGRLYVLRTARVGRLGGRRAWGKLYAGMAAQATELLRVAMLNAQANKKTVITEKHVRDACEDLGIVAPTVYAGGMGSKASAEETQQKKNKKKGKKQQAE